jgi:glycosyltransferase involved in cell wall biosynthesis
MDAPRKEPILSIVMPSFNKGPFIKQSIESVLCCGYDFIELIIIDNLSTDSTIDIIHEYLKRPEVTFVSEGDSGQSDAINKGINLAKGKFVTWLNADDLFFEGALYKVKDVIVSSPSVELIFGSGVKIDRYGNEIKSVSCKNISHDSIKYAMTVLQPAVFFSKSIYRKVGGLDCSLEYAMDWDLFLRMLQESNFTPLDFRIAKLRMYSETKTSLGGWQRSKEIALIGKKHNGILDRNYVSFMVRRLFSLLFFPRKMRLILDHAMTSVWGYKGYMVKNWPK